MTPPEPAGRALKLPGIGLVCVDPLRVLGLQALLGDGMRFRVGVLGGVRAADLAGLDLVIIDSTTTTQLQALIEAFRRLRPQIRLLVIGDLAEDIWIERVIGAGAQGYLAHASTEAELRRAVAVIRDGSIWAPRKVLARLLEQARGGIEQGSTGTGEQPQLTRREGEVLRLLVLGRSNRELAATLQVEESTVKSHLARLMRKAGVRNRTALTMRALGEGWGS